MSIKLRNTDNSVIDSDTDLPSMHVLECTGADTLEFFTNPDKSFQPFYLDTISIKADDAVALTVGFYWKSMGVWGTKYPYIMNLTGLQALQGVNVAYAAGEPIAPFTEAKIEVVTAGACKVGAMILGRPGNV